MWGSSANRVNEHCLVMAGSEGAPSQAVTLESLIASRVGEPECSKCARALVRAILIRGGHSVSRPNWPVIQRTECLSSKEVVAGSTPARPAGSTVLIMEVRSDMSNYGKRPETSWDKGRHNMAPWHGLSNDGGVWREKLLLRWCSGCNQDRPVRDFPAAKVADKQLRRQGRFDFWCLECTLDSQSDMWQNASMES